MELRNLRFKLPILPEPKQRKRRMAEELFESPSARSARLDNRLKRMDDSRDSLTPRQRKRMERKEAEMRLRRDAIAVNEKDSVFSNSSFVSARTLHRQLLAAVLERDEGRMRKLMRDGRMPLDAITTQYSYADDRTPIVEAFASENTSLIMSLLVARAEKKRKGVDESLLEPLYDDSLDLSLFAPFVPSVDSLVLREYAAPEKLTVPLPMQLVPYSIIEMFRPVSLYLDKPEADHTDGVNDIVKQAHALIGGNDGEFYTAADYGTAAVEALRYGHCILALNLSRKNNVFSELTEAILEAATPFAEPSLVTMYKRSNTTHYFLPIHAAAARGRLDVLIWYHQQYASATELMDEDHCNALHYAAASEDSRALKWILAKGGLLKANKQGQTPLHVAVKAGRVENVKIIVSVLEARDCLSLDADDFSLEDNEFLDRRSSVNWKDGEAMSPLHWAATSGNLEIVEALCRHPFINVACKNMDGVTPFMMAAARGHLSCVQNALTHAAINGQSNVVAFLLKSTKTRHDSVDLFHNSALHYACSYGWLPIVRMLVKIDTTILAKRNRMGLIPGICAYRNGHFGIIVWLNEYGFGQFVREDPGKIKISVDQWILTAQSFLIILLVSLIVNAEEERPCKWLGTSPYCFVFFRNYCEDGWHEITHIIEDGTNFTIKESKSQPRYIYTPFGEICLSSGYKTLCCKDGFTGKP
ncbi:hypothetical protein PRIPAC_74036 [Pristionchus pacificus]|uniref:Ankyrin repeat-containing protein n=1 Tax=Pristionchus pacificus TaxID=54126 RepID=A0A2A6BFB3_PRIPA|nr:hypothetical protein PRIPAC_74036 [Pristionchus pacificus]|eukprot:PDM64605.1 Ankyrin repeat-containing protein [Pristionchus pacificus]